MANLNVNIIDIKESLFKSDFSKIPKEEVQGIKIKDHHSVRLDVEDDKNKEFQKISVTYKVILSTNKNETLLELITLESICIFLVKDASNMMEFKDDKIVKIDDQLMFVLLSTSIGTTRGMLSYKLASLPLNYVLPLLDLSKILGKNGKSKMSK